jgi:hypothetical protein
MTRSCEQQTAQFEASSVLVGGASNGQALTDNDVAMKARF